MKKTENKNLLKVILILLVVLLISASLLSRTLARYISSAPLADSTARVAKWGVEINASGDLFADAYAADDSSYTDGDTVISGNQDLVVAPGTSGNSGSFSITGTPEVATRVMIVDRGSTLSGWEHEVSGVNYEPVLWTLTKGATTVVNGGSLADLIAALTTTTYELEPGTDLSGEALDFEISWEWPFVGNDEADTIYGNQEGSDVPTITLALDITVVQVD